VEYIVEVNGSETRLPDAAAVRGLLDRLVASDAAEVWVALDRGPRKRTWLQRLFGVSDRDVLTCFWLAKSGGVSALTFLDESGSEHRATDPAYPVEATAGQRAALSCGEPTPAPVEVCLRAGRAFQAAIEYLRSGERPSWLTYHYVR
jgi:hypothetical protein